MRKTVQEVFNAIQEKKKSQRQVREMYKDAIEASGEYRELVEKIDKLRERKKQLEAQAWIEAGAKDKYETTKLDIKSDRELLNDLAISQLMSGETVKVVDQDNHEYEPRFTVSFKKTNVVELRPQ
jgi:predicted nuclease with TOPRIM domain